MVDGGFGADLGTLRAGRAVYNVRAAAQDKVARLFVMHAHKRERVERAGALGFELRSGVEAEFFLLGADGGGIADAVDDRATGLLVDEEDVAAITAAVLR